MSSIRFLAGLVVQKQILQLPTGLVVGPPDCLVNEQDCCQSGGAAGCCFPRPPDHIWAWRTGASADCGCVLDCVELIYDADRDAWYGGPIADVCGTTADVLLRLKCILGAYHLDCVLRGATPADADLVGLEGVPSASVTFSCDPFLSAWDFDDPAPDVCAAEGTFNYLLSESSCSGSGGGGGGGGQAPCDESAAPQVLSVSMKAGGCDCLPDVMNFQGSEFGHGAAWTTLSCEANDTWFLDCVDGYYVLSTLSGGMVATLVSYSPTPSFELVYDVVVTSGTCPPSGAARVTITE